MGKLRQVSPELWPLIDVILFSHVELIFCGGYHACLQRFYLRNIMTSFSYDATHIFCFIRNYPSSNVSNGYQSSYNRNTSSTGNRHWDQNSGADNSVQCECGQPAKR